MKKLLLLISLIAVTSCISDKDIKSAMGLAQRVIPEASSGIKFQKLENCKKDVFRIESIGEKVVISGNNANSMAVGLNHYLKYFCNVEVGWFKHDSFTLPAKLPAVDKPVTAEARVENRFFLNYCTFGYTMPWWNWEEWEHFIDWMALNGVNLPLAITGQESIWYQVWTELGLSDAKVRNYFTGPAHLPWHRMLNIDYWQGPLPKSWLEGQQALQQKIVAREREFNMRPVLPAFAGHAPQELKEVFPEAKITKLGAWAGYTDEYACSFLDPMDPLFPQIQKKFIEKETELYGSDHIYGIDLFNELTPPSWEPEYLGRVSRQVYESLESADKDAVWLQMTWLFWNERKDWTNDRVEPYITSYPSDKSLLLDYYCERQEVWQRTEKYFGVPYIWCYLGNFGGNTMLVGNINDINTKIENTFVNGGDNFKGIGSTLEGFDCNPFVYQYVFEKVWDLPLHHDIEAWTKKLADQRIGQYDENGREAWKLLIDSIYTAPSTPGQSPLVSIRPTFGKYRTYYANPRIAYDNKNLIEIVRLLLEADGKNSAYLFDITNITRQLLSNHFLEVFRDYENAYLARDRKTMNEKADRMKSLINDIDRLVGTQSYFLVGKWIADARNWGRDEEEKEYFEKNARNIITTWSAKDMLLNDYASRTWNGLTMTFYGERWNRFFTAVDKALDDGKSFDEEHYQAYKKEITDFEGDWWEKCLYEFPTEPQGDSKEIATELIVKYFGE